MVKVDSTPVATDESYRDFLNPERLGRVKAYILDHWQETIRSQPRDEGTLLGLPFPYTVPCCKGAFQEIYYWDTYFTCLGLIESGRVEVAVDNTRNLLSQVQRFGFVPNGNRTYYTTRSQPPYLAALVSKVAKVTGDAGLVGEALPLLRKEYEFWTTKRNTPLGLSSYGHHATDKQLMEFHAEISARAGLPSDPRECLPALGLAMAECESGWDFTPRFEHRCPEFCAVDLNCLLWLYENFFADHGSQEESGSWRDKALNRKNLLNKLCWNEEHGGYFDYDFVNGRQSKVPSVASFQALWSGLADANQAQGMHDRFLPLLECSFGVAACRTESGDRRTQWDYPNGWPCLQYLVSAGLRRYGHTEAADRIAGKYLASVVLSFGVTGDLWEKYNVNDGSTRTFSEKGYAVSSYLGTAGEIQETPADEAPAMMGWTAGVYMALLADLQGMR